MRVKSRWPGTYGFARVQGMKRFAYRMLLLSLLAGLSGAGVAADGGEVADVFSGHVARVLDGDTVVLDNDIRIRLLDINTPEIAHDGRSAEPYAYEAANALRRLVFGQYVTIQTGPQKKDRYDRVLGHIFLPNGGWVNGTLVRDGYAHVYTFAENAVYAPELLAYEKQARESKRGLWALPRWQVREALRCCAHDDIGTFKLVEGRVVAAVHVKNSSGGRTYLNFGKDWRTDFSVFVTDKDNRWFKKAGIVNIADYYRGKNVRIHGYLQPVNGVLVRVTHPAQIEVLE